MAGKWVITNKLRIGVAGIGKISGIQQIGGTKTVGYILVPGHHRDEQGGVQGEDGGGILPKLPSKARKPLLKAGIDCLK
jgi:hypothetical protein